MLRTLPFRARLSLLAILVIPLYGQDGCNELCAIDYVLCNLNSVGDGWCLGGTCVANACTGVDCDDANDCTTDVCDPIGGSCVHTAREEFFPSCDAGGGNQGVCFDTVCILPGTDGCLEPGVGRVNCCAACIPEPTCTPSQYLPNGTSCDPTGAEAAGLPNQEGTCNANGVCVYNAGACAGVVCQDDTTQCVKEWCDPNTYLTDGCESAQIEGSPPCGDGLGACVAGICRSQNSCVGIGSGFRNCVFACGTTGEMTGIPDFFCDPTGALDPSLTADPTLGGICSIDSDCVWQACAIPDPANPGFFVEKNCADLNECTEDECDPATGVCMHTALPDFAPCNNGQGLCFTGWLGAPSWCVRIPGP